MGRKDLNKQQFKSSKFKSVVEDAVKFFVNSPEHNLPPSEKFVGSGVYGLYYTGNFSHYKKLAESNKVNVKNPIYIGKAVPQGWRKGRTLSTSKSEMFNRLSQHARSIDDSSNLQCKDFKCKFVILDEVEGDLIVPVEAYLIRFFRPIWNWLVDGFGNHDPGIRRANQSKSEWDVLHPGRKWAQKLTGPVPDLASIKKKIDAYFLPVP